MNHICIMDNITTHISRYLLFAIGLISTYINEFIGVSILFLLVFVVDFVTGTLASFRSGHKIESNRLRWSFAKTVCYLGTFAFTLICGVCLNKTNAFIEIVKIEEYIAIWIEATSITENLIILFPKFEFFKVMNFMLSTVWVKKISGLMDYLKEKNDKKHENH